MKYEVIEIAGVYYLGPFNYRSEAEQLADELNQVNHEIDNINTGNNSTRTS